MTQQLPDYADRFEDRRRIKATAILRVFNYYRVFLSFCLLLLFIQVPDQQFVGKYAPDVFQLTILAYIGFNILVSLACLVANYRRVSGHTVIYTLLSTDVLFLTLLMYSSGGISTGLGNFLIFPVAFGGVLIRGRSSVGIAAMAVIMLFYSQTTLMLEQGDLAVEALFQAGLLGIALFAVNLLFQHLGVQLRRREEEVITLETLNEMRQLAEDTRNQLNASNARLEVLLQHAGDGILGLDVDGTITFANPKASELIANPDESLAGKNIRDFAFPDENDRTPTRFSHFNLLHLLDQRARATGEAWQWSRANGDRFVVDYSCEAILDASERPTGAVVIFQDATKRQEMEQQLNYLANYDSLTDLVNRGYFQATLEQSVARCARSGNNLCVLLLDLDHFKCVNDQYGHDYGDALLKEVSSRMSSCIRLGDTAARLGGDEFAILLLDFKSPENVALIARNLVEEISRPYDIKGKQLHVSTSIGIAVFDDSALSANDLMKNADIAMYAAKSESRNTYRFFAPEMQYEAESIQRIQMAMNNAIEQDEFQLYYQPIVDLADNSIHHAEALIRWNPRGEDPISPDIFIPIAEETGKINDIGHWVLRNVMHQMDIWRQHFGACPKVAINVSTRQLMNDFFRKQVERFLNQYRLDPEWIELELTETGMMEDPETVLRELVQLHEMGIRISIDDFGTGYSSLDYLRRLPIDQVKIDQSFTQRLGHSHHDEEIVRVILAIARTLKLTVVAEGIETEAQRKFLRENGCDLGQGHLFYKAMDALNMGTAFSDGLPHVLVEENVTWLADHQREFAT